MCKAGTWVCSILILGMCVPLAAGQVIQALVLEGDDVGVGLVTRIDNLAVNDNGDWIVEADTDNANSDIDTVLIRNGVVAYQEGQALALPAGSTLASFDAVNINNNGDSGWNFFLDGTTGIFDDSGIYFNGTLVIQEGDISTAPQFSAGTPYIGFFEAYLNDADQMMLIASIDDPEIASTVDRALVLVETDGAGGLVSETVIAKEADVLNGQVEAVTDFGTGPHSVAFNFLGDTLFVADLTGDTATDGVVYINDRLIAQEGSASPVGGRNWGNLSNSSSSTRVDLNNQGGYVFIGRLDGSTADDTIIVSNNQKVIQEGDTLPAIGGVFTFTSFGTGPVQISRCDVMWYGDWDDPQTAKDTGLFLNDTLVVHEGSTGVGANTFTGIAGGQDAFQLSDNGRYAIFEATLDTGEDGAFLITFPDPCPGFLCGDANCDGAVDAEDIDPFFLAVGDAAAWQAMYPACNLLCVADILCDGAVDAEDIDPFFVAIGIGGCP